MSQDIGNPSSNVGEPAMRENEVRPRRDKPATSTRPSHRATPHTCRSQGRGGSAGPTT